VASRRGDATAHRSSETDTGMQTYDTLYKSLFDHPAMVEDLLREAFAEHPGFVDSIDFGSLRPMPGDMVSDHYQRRLLDRAWHFEFGDERRFVIAALEFQSTVDPHMALRTLAYSALAVQGFVRNTSQRRNATDAYPPVVPIVLYSGQRRWSAALDVAHRFGHVNEALNAHLPRQRYILVEQSNLCGELQGTHTLCRALANLIHGNDAELAVASIAAVIRQLGTEHDGLTQLYADICCSVAKQSGMLAEQTKEGMTLGQLHNVMLENQKKMVQGWINEGREEGMRKGIEQVAEAMLNLGHDDKSILECTGISETRLGSLKNRRNATE